MKNKKIIIILILIILISIVLIFKSNKNKLEFDDFIFLKLFQNIKQNDEHKNQNEYIFKVKYNNTQTQTINLFSTISSDFKEKIYPGAHGNFKISLKSNEELKYKIQFESLNLKPKNLKFSAYIDEEKVSEGRSLEEMEDKINKRIESIKNVDIIIRWWWDYDEFEKEYPKFVKEIQEKQYEEDEEEKQKQQDEQDTQDGKNIKTYNFKIHITGEKNNE